jgi:hypothetical protein
MHIKPNKNNFCFISEMELDGIKNQFPFSMEALLFSIINFAFSHRFLTSIF